MSYYDTRYTFDSNRNKVWRAISEFLQKYINEDFVVLDLGSGYADFINCIKAKKKIAVDINSESKKYCDKDVVFIKSPSTDLGGVKDKSIDTVFVSNLFEHLDLGEINLTLKEIKKVLKKNGILIIIQPNFRYAYKNYFDDYTHKSIFTHTSLSDLLKSNGFSVILEKPKFLPLSLKSKLPKSYILTKLYVNSPLKPLGKQMLLILGLKDVER